MLALKTNSRAYPGVNDMTWARRPRTREDHHHDTSIPLRAALDLLTIPAARPDMTRDLPPREASRTEALTEAEAAAGI